MINVFRGVPITYDATITMISQGYVAINVHAFQAVCISLDKRTYIQSEYIPEPVKGHPVAVDIISRDVILNRFTYAEKTFGNRMSLRVQPKEPLHVIIHAKNSSVTATLADLSSKGMGIFAFETRVENRMDYKRGDPIEMVIKLPRLNNEIKLKGSITNITQERGTILTRLGIHTDPEQDSEHSLLDYITDRKAEIMEELEVIYETMKKSKIKK